MEQLIIEESNQVFDNQLLEQEYYREGKIVILEGPQRSGKTLGMAICALDEYTNQKSEILTNIAYENPITKQIRIPYKPLNFFELTMEHISEVKNRAITIDELNFYLDSRGSMTKVNRRFSQWLLQSKKMGINTYGTTHNLSYLDLRFRENFDYLIQPRTHYESWINPVTRLEVKRPIALVLKWFNGPNQKHFRKTMTFDFRKNPGLLNMYNSRHTFNPFAQIEAQTELEKQQKKTQSKATALRNIVPSMFTNGGLSDGNKKNIST